MSPTRLSASQVPDSFESIINPLLNFKRNSRLTSLLSYQNESYLKYFTGLFSPAAKFEKQDLKEIKHRFQDWTAFLNRKLISSMNNYFKMYELKKKCCTLVDKIEWIREKVRSEEEFVSEPSLSFIKSLNNLEEVIYSINLAEGPESLSHQFFKKPPKNNSLTQSKEYIRQTSERFSSLTGEKNKELLISEFLAIDSPEYFIALGEVITLEQALKIIEETSEKNDQKLIDKLPFFIFSLNFEVLQQVICSHTIDLEKLNELFLKAQIFKSSKKTIQHFITYQCQQFCKFSNAYGQLIDDLDEKFRLKDIEDISFSDLDELYLIKEKIEREFEIFKRFQFLIKFLPVNQEIRSLIFGDAVNNKASEVEKTFILNIKRMSDDIQVLDDDSLLGCPFKILERKFDDVLKDFNADADISVEKDDSALDIFPVWKILSRENLLSSELLKHYPEEILTGADLYKIFGEDLKDIGIKTIKDLFSLHIYNVDMLKEYIKKCMPKLALNQSILTKKT